MKNLVLGLLLGISLSCCFAEPIQDNPVLGPAWRNGFRAGVTCLMAATIELHRECGYRFSWKKSSQEMEDAAFKIWVRESKGSPSPGVKIEETPSQSGTVVASAAFIGRL